MIKAAKILSNSNFTQSLIMTSGTVFNSFLGLIFYVLAGRALGPAGLGLLVSLINIGVFVSEVGDWGVTSSLVKLSEGGNKISNFLGPAILHRTAVSVFILTVSSTLAFLLGSWTFICGLIAVSLLMVSLVGYSFLAKQQYGSYLFTNISGNFLRLMVGVWLFINFHQEPVVWLGLWIGSNFFGALIGYIKYFLVDAGEIQFKPDFKTDFKTLLGFSGWLGGSFSLASIIARLDVPVVLLLGGSFVAGIYASAQKLAGIVPQIVSALDSVFAPKFSQKMEFHENVKDYFKLCLIGSGVILSMVPFYGLILRILFGEKYVQASPIFSWLMVGMAVFVLVAPLTCSVVYRFAMPKKQFTYSLIQVFLTFGLYFTLIPKFGINGVTGTFIGINILMLIIYGLTFLRLVKNG